MPSFTANGKKLEADFFVFDKDGLMFDSEQFWIELITERCRNLLSICTVEQVLDWARMMGGDTAYKDGEGLYTTYVDPLGILAVASPSEEKAITAAYLVSVKGLLWHEARDAAAEIFERSDQQLDLRKAFKPQPGFVKLMHRLMELDVPHGVATSDTFDRTKYAMSLYDCWDKVSFVITPEDVKEGKPAPDMLRLVSERTGISLDRIAMVGDSYVDVKMAENAGCIGIGVSTDREMKRKMAAVATVVLNSLEEIVI